MKFTGIKADSHSPPPAHNAPPSHYGGCWWDLGVGQLFGAAQSEIAWAGLCGDGYGPFGSSTQRPTMGRPLPSPIKLLAPPVCFSAEPVQ
jgi:hypothetical protein